MLDHFILADDVTAVLHQREQNIKDFGRQRHHFTIAQQLPIIGRYDKDDLRVRAYGDTAVSSHRMTAWGTFEGTEIKRALCITNV